MNGDGRADVVQYLAGASSLPVCFSTDTGWSCSALSVPASLASTTSTALPAASALVASFGSGHASLVELAPESGATKLPVCTVASSGWSCTTHAATLY
jgi:hypothetical protein